MPDILKEDGSLELYDLAKDVDESDNLAARMPEKAKEMHQLLVRWRKNVKANMPRPNPEVSPLTTSTT